MLMDIKFGLALQENGYKVTEKAINAEVMGFDSVWIGEHVVWLHPIHDSLMVLSALSSVTTTIQLGTGIVLLSLKHPVLLCKAVTTLDHLSDGRVRFGIGIGGEYPKEFEAMGIPVVERGPRTDEALDLMKKLWSQDSVTYKGRFFEVKDIKLDPPPIQKPHPPIMVGGRRKSLRRVGMYGDGWIPYMYSPEIYKEDWLKIAQIAEGAGRDPSSIERTVWVPICLDDTYEKAAKVASKSLGGNYGQSFDHIVRKYAILGTPEQCAERMYEYHRAGVEHFIFSPSGPEELTSLMPDVIMRAVIPLFNRQLTSRKLQ